MTRRAIEAWTGGEFGAVKPLDSRATGLGSGRASAYEQPPARNAELPGHVAGDEFALIEPPRTAPGCTGGRPRHHIERTVIAPGHDGVHHEAGEVPGHLPTVAVLEAEHHLSRPTGERQSCMHPMAALLRTRSEQSKAARGAHRSTWGVTTGTTNLEHHGTKCDEGVSQS